MTVPICVHGMEINHAACLHFSVRIVNRHGKAAPKSNSRVVTSSTGLDLPKGHLNKSHPPTQTAPK